MKTWFTSDTHFGHNNIIKYCSRPFADVQEMDNAMINRWNETVAPSDTVWHLGDFSLGDVEQVERYFRRLHGDVHLIWGNHDRPGVRSMPLWASSRAYAEITVDGAHLVLFHYAMKVWPRCHRGGLHLYGHSHNALPADDASCDVGVDAWGYRPVSLQQIKQRLAHAPPRLPVDHHG